MQLLSGEIHDGDEVVIDVGSDGLVLQTRAGRMSRGESARGGGATSRRSCARGPWSPPSPRHCCSCWRPRRPRTCSTVAGCPGVPSSSVIVLLAAAAILWGWWTMVPRGSRRREVMRWARDRDAPFRSGFRVPGRLRAVTSLHALRAEGGVANLVVIRIAEGEVLVFDRWRAACPGIRGGRMADRGGAAGRSRRPSDRDPAPS